MKTATSQLDIIRYLPLICKLHCTTPSFARSLLPLCVVFVFHRCTNRHFTYFKNTTPRIKEVKNYITICNNLVDKQIEESCLVDLWRSTGIRKVFFLFEVNWVSGICVFPTHIFTKELEHNRKKKIGFHVLWLIKCFHCLRYCHSLLD